MLEFLHTFLLYPASEVIHSLQGVLAGWLGFRAIEKKEPSDAICSLLVTIAFATYEGFERWRIGDAADQDLEVFWVTAVITGLICALHYLWKKYRR